MSYGVSLCIECERFVGLSWGDVNCNCRLCGGDLVFGYDRQECETERDNKKKLREEIGYVFSDGKYVRKDDKELILKQSINEIGA